MSAGYRGYIASRPVRGTVTPQRVQNLVIRDYAARRKLDYLLSAAEYAMPGSYMMLENVLAEMPKLQGVIFFSAFMLPPESARRHILYTRILSDGGELHAALENLAIRSEADIPAFEDLVGTALLLVRVPFAGRYDKTTTSLRTSSHPFAAALTAGETL